MRFKEQNQDIMRKIKYILQNKNVDIPKLLNDLDIPYYSFLKQLYNTAPVNINHLNSLLEVLKLKLNTVIHTKMIPFKIINIELAREIKLRIKEMRINRSKLCLLCNLNEINLKKFLDCSKGLQPKKVKRICKILLIKFDDYIKDADEIN